MFCRAYALMAALTIYNFSSFACENSIHLESNQLKLAFEQAEERGFLWRKNDYKQRNELGWKNG